MGTTLDQIREQERNHHLEHAAQVLDQLAAGEMPRKTDLIGAALLVTRLADELGTEDLRHAALGLERLATGRPLDLDGIGKVRAAKFAGLVRAQKTPEEPKRGRGRPKLSQAEKLIPVTVRLTEVQRDKLQRLGPDALRAWIDSCPEQISLPL